MKLAIRISKSKRFQEVLFANYMDFSNGITLNEYAENERKILAMGFYGVEDFHIKVNEYLKFLDEIILRNKITKYPK
ncbi:hypothetical protein [Flagellimonas sp. SN16]|uniref:hypothetical protein n=1 Tax=Flagellimonas sp. SN16 TaxID=3415142 RepID=UPI003C628915